MYDVCMQQFYNLNIYFLFTKDPKTPNENWTICINNIVVNYKPEFDKINKEKLTQSKETDISSLISYTQIVENHNNRVLSPWFGFKCLRFLFLEDKQH